MVRIQSSSNFSYVVENQFHANTNVSLEVNTIEARDNWLWAISFHDDEGDYDIMNYDETLYIGPISTTEIRYVEEKHGEV